jgi:hypothetical protein
MHGRYSVMTLALASLFPLASSFAAETKLVKAVSEHFELYTTDNDAAAKAALTHFETVRGFLLKTLHAEDPFAGPVRIVAFKSAGEYAPYVPGGGDAAGQAFSVSKGDKPAIVMAGLKKDDYQFGVREYASLLLDRLDPKMPYWLKLGLSEFYSTLRPDNGVVHMGAEPARSFRGEVSPDFNMQVMFALNGGINRNKGAADFYTQSSQLSGSSTGSTSSTSTNQFAKGDAMANMEATTTVNYPVILWQLTHMLMFKKEYSPKFGAFVGALNGGNTDAVLGQVYGQSLAGLKEDLLLYIKMPAHEVLSVKYQLDGPVTPQVSQLNPTDSMAVLAELRGAK